MSIDQDLHQSHITRIESDPMIISLRMQTDSHDGSQYTLCKHKDGSEYIVARFLPKEAHFSVYPAYQCPVRQHLSLAESVQRGFHND
jgi:hypothetical protein